MGYVPCVTKSQTAAFQEDTSGIRGEYRLHKVTRLPYTEAAEDFMNPIWNSYIM